MKGIAILNAHTLYPSSLHFYERMKEEFAKFDVELELARNSELLTYINSEGGIESKLNGYSFCLYVDKDPYVMAMVEKLGIKMFDSEEAIRLCDDKMLTYITLAGHGIRMPKTIGYPLNYCNDVSEEYLQNVVDQLGFPLVAKTNFGSLGSGVFLIKNIDELRDFSFKKRFDPHLYQKFIASSAGKDYRIIVLNGKFLAGMMRKNENDFRSNIGAGGSGIKVAIPQKFIDVAEKAAQILGLDYCGVDILDDNGEPILCEVNSNAFLKGIEKTSGVNVAEAYVKHILKKLSYL